MSRPDVEVRRARLPGWLLLGLAVLAAPAARAERLDAGVGRRGAPAASPRVEVDVGQPPDGGAAAPWSPARATPFPDATRAALEAVVREAREGGPTDGLAVAVLHGDQAWLAAFGLASVAPRRPATPTTSFRVGSLTKTFTAVATLQLAAEGRLSLDDDVRTLVPAFPQKPWPVTVRQLLGHTGGLGWYRGPKDAWTTTPTTPAQALDLFKDRPLAFEPGTDFLYSSFGYVLLGLAVERAAGAPYARVLERTAWGPLGLSRTGLEASAKTHAERAEGYRLVKGQLRPARVLDLSSRFSSGGLRSTVEDLSRWARALLDGRVVDAPTWRAMTSPGVTTLGEVTDYGLGFAVYPVRGRMVVAHAGGVPGAAALVLLIPEADFAVVLLSNLQHQAPGLMALATHLSEVVLDDGLPRRGWYSAARADEVAFDGLSRVLSHGLARRHDPEPPAGAAPAEAFAALQALFSPARCEADPEAARLALKEAYHARHGRVSAVAGAEMARVLELRGQRLRDYTGPRGPAAFFVDYARACAATSCPHPLGPALTATAERLDAQWQRTPRLLLTVRREHLDATPGLGGALAALDGLPAHVDLVDELTRLAWRQRAKGRVDESRATLEGSRRLHPASPLAALALAEAAALDGDVGGAVARFGEALALARGPLQLTRELVKARAEARQVGATRAGVAALDALVEQANAALPASTPAVDPGGRGAGPTVAAPDPGDAPRASTPVDGGTPRSASARGAGPAESARP